MRGSTVKKEKPASLRDTLNCIIITLGKKRITCIIE